MSMCVCVFEFAHCIYVYAGMCVHVSVSTCVFACMSDIYLHVLRCMMFIFITIIGKGPIH